MAASLSGVWNAQHFTDLGAFMAGGRLYTYAAGTTTHKTAFTDAAASVAHTYTNDGSGGQYIAINARGELPAPLFLTSGGYDLALKTSAGVTVWTRRAAGGSDAADTLRADLADTDGATLVGYGSDTVKGALDQLIDHFRTPQYYGAVGDGVTDDTPAFDLAAASGKVILIPNGDYYLTKNYDSTGTGMFLILGKVTWTNANYRVLAAFNMFGNTTSRVASSMTTGREELQIYSAGPDAYSTGSRGAGFHLYGNGDGQHAGNMYIMTGPDDLGDARIIICGGSNNASSGGYPGYTDTRIVIGNAITDYVDTMQAKAMLTLKNPEGVPALYIVDASETEGDLAVATGDKFLAGHWDGTTFTPRMGYTAAGAFITGGATTDFYITLEDTAGASIDSTGQLRVSRDDGVAAAFKRMNSDGQLIGCYRDRVGVGGISVTTTATAFNTSSDYRLKFNVTDADQAAAVASVLAFPWKNFEFYAAPGVLETGVLAHELQAVKPSAVTGTKDAIGPNGEPAYQGVDYSKLVPDLGVALKYALAKIEELEGRIATLEGA